MLSKFGPESWALWAIVSAFLFTLMLDCCTAQLHIPIRDILLSEIDHIVLITKKVHVMFHETAPRKLRVFTLYVYPKMLNGVSHFNLLDELINTFRGLFLVFFFFIKSFSKQQRRTCYDATVVMWRLIWVCTV